MAAQKINTSLINQLDSGGMDQRSPPAAAAVSGCKSRIYCDSELLQVIQRSRIFSDSKTFVDMPTKQPVEQVLADFEQNIKLNKNATEEEIRAFVQRNFDPPGMEMRVVLPEDWKQQPTFLDGIKDRKLLVFARAIHEKWRSLVRSFDQSYLCKGCTASSFKLPAPFVIPGGRFREFYYWDSYWILEGLYVSEMCGTARNVIDNMLALINKFGFIPNGSRVYYLNRSQPPLFASMMERYLEECTPMDQEALMNAALPLMEREYTFWMSNRSYQLATGETLNRYQADLKGPRPESFIEDEEYFGMSSNASHFYQSIASAAESGWDFSSRWFADYKTIPTIRTTHILPVDLNAVLYGYERTMAKFYRQYGKDASKAEVYEAEAVRRAEVMEKIFWNGTIWLDYDATLKAHCANPTSLYMSALSPLWFHVPTEHMNDEKYIWKALLRYDDLLQKYPGGVPISSVVSGQQWDFPNVWAPVQHRMIVLYQWMYTKFNNPKYQQRALELAQKWIDSAFCGYEKYGTHNQLIDVYNRTSV